MIKRENHIITITSDWGIKDYYLAVVKGQILSRFPNTTFVDISNSVKPFEIAQAAFLLKNSFLYFPKGTWHVIEVAKEYPPYVPCRIMKYKDHFFIGRDEGIFALLLDEQDIPAAIYEIPDPPKTLFPMRDIFIPTLIQIFSGIEIEKVAPRCSTIKPYIPSLPIVSKFRIEGQIVYIDNYENFFTNISRNAFETAANSAALLRLFIGVTTMYYEFYVKDIDTLYKTESGLGSIFFVNDYLVVGVKHGNAIGVLGGKEEEKIIIEFQ